MADSTVKRILKEMVSTGVLIEEGERKARRYLKASQTPGQER